MTFHAKEQRGRRRAPSVASACHQHSGLLARECCFARIAGASAASHETLPGWSAAADDLRRQGTAPTVSSASHRKETEDAANRGSAPVPSLTQERYEEVVRRLTNGKSGLKSPTELPFDGLLVHVAAQTDHGFLIFDVFESQESADGFNGVMGTIPKEVGIEEPPTFYPAHTFISVATRRSRK